MTLVSSHDWHDHIDLIEGDFYEEDLGGAELKTPVRLSERSNLEDRSSRPKSSDAPLKELLALCLLCYASHPIGKYIYENYPIELEDGTTTTFEDWRAEAGRNRVGKSRRRRMYCPRCDFLTEHVAEC